MSLTPLLAASATIQLHAFAALAALGLGLVQVLAPAGDLRLSIRDSVVDRHGRLSDSLVRTYKGRGGRCVNPALPCLGHSPRLGAHLLYRIDEKRQPDRNQ